MDNRIAIGLGVVALAAVGFLIWSGVSEPATKQPIPIPTEAPAPKHPWPDAELEGTELKSATVSPGKGETPRSDQLVEVSWKGWLVDTEIQFADIQPRRFVLSESDAVPGVNAALAQMRPGETRLLQLPPALAYGQTGDPPLVPRDAEVMMLVTLHGVEDVVEAPEAPAEATADQEDGALKYAILKPGTGAMPKQGDTVSIHVSTFLEGGKRLDSTYTRHAPIDVVVGKGQLFAGLDQGLVKMKVGEKRKLVIPPELAAGEKGRGPIPPNATLVLEVELLGIE